eukprot:TRINITY_DN1324_c0_g1_i1.p1 TRINITY_DN1324_c0_g1~~TRINITY_DN1324_c0_g1_i1.p1  ORF type:complete len:185 (+),score=0.05 TRINITY_DN1324_c0_g1_i1:104-658(+)
MEIRENKSICDPVMESKISKGKREYSIVSLDKRQELIDLIESQTLTLKDAAEKVGIKYSTAKNIVKIYVKEQRINPKPKRVSKILKQYSCLEEEGIPLSMSLTQFPYRIDKKRRTTRFKLKAPYCCQVGDSHSTKLQPPPERQAKSKYSGSIIRNQGTIFSILVYAILPSYSSEVQYSKSSLAI